MKRPNIEDYKLNDGGYSQKYITDLEKYCNQLEKALEKHQKEIERQVKKQIEADKKIADKQRRDSERQARMDARRERASSIVVGQPTVGDIRILDDSAEELVSLICKGYSLS